jgi:DNA-binding FadR family transcriptional regulator
MWRAQAGQEGAEPTPRRAMVVATEIRARIAEGRLREGDRLPPLAELADEFGISRPTLREALRILEMEFLLDLRTGDRGGATIRTPSSRVAAQLAGIVLEARGTTLGDFYRAMRLMEPPMMGLVAARIGPKQLRTLETMNAALADSIEDTSRFLITLRDAEQLAFSAVKNPALTVISEILHWVRVGVEPAVTADVKAIPGISKSNHNFQMLFSEFVAAGAERDAARATAAWATALEPNAPWLEESGLGNKLMLDLMD